MARKYFHLLVKAVGHKYIKRVPKSGGGYTYYYKEPSAKEERKTQVGRTQEVATKRRVEAFEEKAGFRVAVPLGWAVSEHGLSDAEKNKLRQQFVEHMPHFKMTSNPEKNRDRAAMIFNHWAEGAKMDRKRKAKEGGVKDQPHSVWASAAAAQLGREIGLPEGSLWVPPMARRIEKLVTSGKMTREEALKETRFSLGLSIKQKTKEVPASELTPKQSALNAAEAVNKLRSERWPSKDAADVVRKVMKERPELETAKEITEAAKKELKAEQMISEFKERATTKKSFTEENLMNEELSLSEQEGARIAMEVREGEEALVEKLVKAAEGPELLEKAVGHKYLRRVMTAGGYRYIYEEHPSVKQAAPKGSPAAQRLASAIRRSHSVAGKHISDKAHDAVMAAKFHGKRRAKEHLDKIEQAHAEHRKVVGRAIESAREKGIITHAEAMKLRKYQDKHGGSLANAIEHLKGLARDPKGALAQKSFTTEKTPEQLAVEAALSHSPAALVKAVIEVPVHSKTRKKSIPDERLLAIFSAHVRTEYRNASRYGDGTNAQSIYDSVLSSAEYNDHVEAALGLLEKLKTPFSVDFVKRCIQEIEDAQKEASQIAPEPTAPSSIAASGG